MSRRTGAWRLCGALVLVLACSRKPAAPAAAETKPSPQDPPNVLELWRGAALVSRTGEATLKESALRTIDSDLRTGWLSPPSDPEQTLVYSFAAPTRVDHLGVYAARGSGPSSVRFELSADGEHFTPAGSLVLQSSSTQTQTLKVSPSAAGAASYLRISTPADGRTVQINTIYATGIEEKAVATPVLDGCWSINGSPAIFTQRGAAVTGYVSGNEKTVVDGGFDGRFYRFAWLHGPEYGLAAISVDPHSQHLGGLVWHEEALELPQFLAPDWIGERAPCSATAAGQPDVLLTFLRRLNYAPLYGLRFDDGGSLQEGDSAATLDRVTSFLAGNRERTVRFLVHHLMAPTPQENRTIAQRKSDTLRDALLRRGTNMDRVELVVLGAEKPRREASIATARAMYSSVELEVAP